MNLKEIHFKHGFSLYLSSNISSVQNYSQEVIEEIKQLSISSVIIADNAVINSRLLKHLENIFPDLSIIKLNPEKLLKKNWHYVKKNVELIRHELKGKNCLLLFSAIELISFIYCITINPKKPEVPGKLGSLELNNQNYINEYLHYLENIDEDYLLNTVSESKIKNKISIFSIRSKLLTITSMIVILSLSIVIFLASYLFREYSQRLIQEYNLSLSRLIGKTVEDRFNDILYKTSEFSYTVTDNFHSPLQENQLANRFFRSGKEIIFVSIARIENNSVSLLKNYANPHYIKEFKLTDQQLKSVAIDKSDTIKQTQFGKQSIINISEKLKLPAIFFTFPLEKNLSIIVFLSSGELLEVFQNTRQTELIELLLVNQTGEVIAHSNENLVMDQANYLDMPIIKTMLNNPSRNGSRKYIYNTTEYLGSFQILSIAGLGVVSTVPVEKIFAAVYKIQNQNLIIMLMILTIAVITVYFFSKTISVPIVNLVQATSQIEHGKYDINIKSTTHDEIGILTDSFISMAHGLKEKEFIKEAFGKFVNPLIAEKAIKGEITLGGEIRDATIFFADIRGFTNISEVSTPHQIVEMLNMYFSALVECIHLTNGIVDKFIGDAVMAHWGAIEENPQDPNNAVHAALLIRKSLQELNIHLANEKRPLIKIGIGINTGPVIAGQIGSNKRLEYTVIGDAVNLASRIEYLNKHFGSDILISEHTYNLISQEFKCIRMPEIIVKGKEKPQIVYAVLGLTNDPNTPENLSELRKIIGIEFNLEEAEKEISLSSDKLVEDLKRVEL